MNPNDANKRNDSTFQGETTDEASSEPLMLSPGGPNPSDQAQVGIAEQVNEQAERARFLGVAEDQKKCILEFGASPDGAVEKLVSDHPDLFILLTKEQKENMSDDEIYAYLVAKAILFMENPPYLTPNEVATIALIEPSKNPTALYQRDMAATALTELGDLDSAKLQTLTTSIWLAESSIDWDTRGSDLTERGTAMLHERVSLFLKVLNEIGGKWEWDSHELPILLANETFIHQILDLHIKAGGADYEDRLRKRWEEIQEKHVDEALLMTEEQEARLRL